jgi:cell wall-associated protease
MKNTFLINAIFSILIIASSSIFAQALPGTLNWYNGEGAGMFTNKAYGLLKNKKSQPVIVAVIDSGVDIEHEDLKGKIWVNTDEIPNNNIDDDKNGYIDDVYGWNFIGNANGQNLDAACLEKTRILKVLMDKYDGVDAASIKNDKEFELYLEVKSEVENGIAEYEPYLESLDQFDADTRKYITDQIDYLLNVNFDDRALIGDNPDDFNDKYYGNANVEGPDALHGTHVAGIIAALRGNGLGGDGVADNVKIMSVRTVPNGDEHDKDVALAIRYAVDNGAMVINMSFGKNYSPCQDKVMEAILYADSKGVLMVHASGNDAKDTDVEPNFPTAFYDAQDSPTLHWLSVGASTKDKDGLVASFSNFGRQSVDVFAPGFEIYNSVPQSDYQNLQGTSMASPMVAGVAAMLKSYFPSLSMLQIREAIVSSVTIHKELTKLCNSGGTVNVYNAVKACQKLESGK